MMLCDVVLAMIGELRSYNKLGTTEACDYDFVPKSNFVDRAFTQTYVFGV